MKTKLLLLLASVLVLFSCTDDFIGDGSNIKRVVVCYYDAELGDYNTVTVTVEEAELMITYGAYLGVCEDEETDPTTAILDEAFEQELINLGYDDVLDGVVLTENISGVVYLDLRFLGIADLTGIEDFSSLVELYLTDNNLSSLDISANTLLERLDVQNNALTVLDISNNSALKFLRCEGNNLTSLDVSQNPLLETLKISNNSITSIDVTNLEFLGSLWIDRNQISEIDVSQNSALFAFVVRSNPISELDVTNNPDLKRFEFWQTQVASIDLANNPALEILRCQQSELGSLDLSNNGNLNVLNCQLNPNLSSLNLRNGNNENISVVIIDRNAALTCIQVDDVTFAETNWTKDDTATFSEDCSSL